MFKIVRVFASLLLLLTASLSLVNAQEATTYGDIIEGEMTEEEYEFEYTFEAQEGEVVAAFFTDPEQTGNLYSPIMMLMNPAGDMIADTSDSFTFGDLTLFAEINSTGTYTLFVTRLDGEEGTDYGVFNIEIFSLPMLEVGTLIEGSVSSEGRSEYYVAQADSAWAVSYVKADGDLDIELTVSRIDSSIGGLEALATASGTELTEVALGIFEAGDTYIVGIGEPLFAFNFEEVSTDYALELLTFED